MPSRAAGRSSRLATPVAAIVRPGLQPHLRRPTSTLVPGAIAVARPAAAKINPCVKAKAKAPVGGECTSSDFPMFAYVDAQLFASRTAAGARTCFNSGGVVFACD